MELLTFVYETVTTDPMFLWFIVGLLLASIGLVFAFTLPDGKVEITNDKYTPTEAVTASKRKQRYIN